MLRVSCARGSGAIIFSGNSLQGSSLGELVPDGRERKYCRDCKHGHEPEIPGHLMELVYEGLLDLRLARRIAKGYKDDQARWAASYKSSGEGSQNAENERNVDEWGVVPVKDVTAVCSSCGGHLMDPEVLDHPQPQPKKRKKRHESNSPIELPEDQVVTGGSNLSPTELVSFFRVFGMCQDQEFQRDIAAHVEALGRNQDRDGFVKFVRDVNRAVKTFAKQFKYTGPVAATLNKILVKTRSHEGMVIPTALPDKLRGEVFFEELQADGKVKKYTTKKALLAWVVQEFTFFLRDFSIDKCGFDDDVVQFAKDYYLPDLPDGSIDLVTMIRSKCIGGAEEVNLDVADAVAGPAPAATPPNHTDADLTGPIQQPDGDRPDLAVVDTEEAGSATNISLYETLCLSDEVSSPPPLFRNHNGMDDCALGNDESVVSSDEMDEDPVSLTHDAGGASTLHNGVDPSGGLNVFCGHSLATADALKSDSVSVLGLEYRSGCRFDADALVPSQRNERLRSDTDADDVATARATRATAPVLRPLSASATKSPIRSLALTRKFDDDTESDVSSDDSVGSSIAQGHVRDEILTCEPDAQEPTGVAQSQSAPQKDSDSGLIHWSEKRPAVLVMKHLNSRRRAMASILIGVFVIGLSVGLATRNGVLAAIAMATFGIAAGLVCTAMAWFWEDYVPWIVFGWVTLIFSLPLGLTASLASEWKIEPPGFIVGITIAVLLLAVAVGSAVGLYIHRAATWKRRVCLGSAALQSFLSTLAIGLAVGLTQVNETNQIFIAGMVIVGVFSTTSLALAVSAGLTKSRPDKQAMLTASMFALAVAVLIGLPVGLSHPPSNNNDSRGIVIALSVLFTLSTLFGIVCFAVLRIKRRRADELQLGQSPIDSFEDRQHAGVRCKASMFHFAGAAMPFGDALVIFSDIAAHMTSARAAQNAALMNLKEQYAAVTSVGELTLAQFERVRRLGLRNREGLPGRMYSGSNAAVFLMNLKTNQGTFPMAIKVLFAIVDVNSHHIRDGFSREEDLTNWANQRQYCPYIVTSFGTFMDEATKATLGDAWDADESIVQPHTVFMAMEYLPLSLEQLISERTEARGCGVATPQQAQAWPPVLTPAEFILILQSLLLAVCYLVQNGVAHRDIKPDNIMLDGPCTGDNAEMTADSSPTVVKLADFGEACLSLRVPMVHRNVVRGGAPTYLAPEVLNAEPGTLDKPNVIDYTKNDVYAVGMVGHYMVTNGLADKDGGNQAFTTWAHELMAQNTYRGLPEGCPQAIRDLLWDMVNPVPDQRISERVALDRVNAMIEGDPMLLAWRVDAETVRSHNFRSVVTEV